MNFIKGLMCAITLASTAMAQLPEEAKMAFGKEFPVKELTDGFIQAGEQKTLSKDTIYVLMEKVFIEQGATLTIEPGTVIKGMDKKLEDATALIVCMGAYIIADGKKDAPIIMTSVNDNLDPENSSMAVTGQPHDTKSDWGGLVILGRAPTNEGAKGFRMEGTAAAETRAYGGLKGVGSTEAGTDWEDSSGVIRYVSIRHAGVQVTANRELNSLSMIGVGSKTVMEYIEVFACGDDGIEIWGGAANLKYCVAAFTDDDYYDFDLGYRGKLQFIFAISDSIDAGASEWLGEWDGDDTKGAEPFAMWKVANATFIGGGQTSNLSRGIIMRANAGAHVYNSIITNTKHPYGLVIEDDPEAGVQDARKRFEDGDITFKSNIFWNIGNAANFGECLFWRQGSNFVAAPEIVDSFAIWGNTYANPLISNIAYSAEAKKLDPRLFSKDNGNAAIGYKDLADLPNDPFWTTVDFKGAFGQTNWMKGWTALDQYGYIGDLNDDKIVSTVRKNRVSSAVAALKVSVSRQQLSAAIPVAQAGTMRVILRDARGRVVTRSSSRVESGVHTLNMDVSRIANGHYTLETSVGGQVSRATVNIMK